MSFRYLPFIRNPFKSAIVVMAALVLFSSVTVFAITLEPGQNIILDNHTFTIGKKLGEGYSADVYHIYSTSNPSLQYVMRSPRVSENLSSQAAEATIQSIQLSLVGFELISSLDPNKTKWRWSPRIIEVPLNPLRKIYPHEKILGWDKSGTEPVIIIPLAEGSLIDIKNAHADSALENKIRLATQTYRDLIPELQNLIHHQVVHGDIKPGNVLIDKNGRAGLSDFEGLVRQGGITQRATRNFSAPEIEVAEGKLTFAADLYSTGKTLLWILLSEAEWDRFGVTWDGLYRATQYKLITKKLDQIEDAIKRNSKESQTVDLEMLNFIRHSLHMNPTKRISELRKTVTSFKNIKPPNEKDARRLLARQGLVINTKAALENIFQSVRYGLNKDLERDLNFITNTTTAKPQDKVAEIKTALLTSNLTEAHLQELSLIPISDSEKASLITNLNSAIPERRAWSALRLVLGSHTNDNAIDLFLADTASFLELTLLERIYKINSDDKTQIEYLISLLDQRIEHAGNTEGLLKLLSMVKLETVLSDDSALKYLKVRDPNAKKYFASHLTKRNFKLPVIADILVKNSINGDSTPLLENLERLKPYVTPILLDSLFAAAMDRTVPSALGNQRVLSKLGTLSPAIQQRFVRTHPGLNVNEITGLYRYRQGSIGSLNLCLQFYKQNQ